MKDLSTTVRLAMAMRNIPDCLDHIKTGILFRTDNLICSPCEGRWKRCQLQGEHMIYLGFATHILRSRFRGRRSAFCRNSHPLFCLLSLCFMTCQAKLTWLTVINMVLFNWFILSLRGHPWILLSPKKSLICFPAGPRWGRASGRSPYGNPLELILDDIAKCHSSYIDALV